MSIPEILAWFAAAYLTGGALTVAAVACLGRARSCSQSATPNAVHESPWLWLKLFALWPSYVMMGAVFAVLMLFQRRQSRPPQTSIEHVVCATQFLAVVCVSAVSLPFCLVPALVRLFLRRGRRP